VARRQNEVSLLSGIHAALVRKMSWRFLSELSPHPFFKKILFLEGFYSSSNSYVILDDGLTIIDPGNDYTAFIELFELGFDPSDIKRIIITHGDYTHCMGVLELMNYQNTRKDLEIVMHEMGPVTLREIINKIGWKVTNVRGGEILKARDSNLKVIHTPGHSIDSICLYHEDSQTLFTGDTVLPGSVAIPNPAAMGDIREYILSIRAIRKIPVEALLPGHGMPIVGNCGEVIEKTYEELIKSITGDIEWGEAANILIKHGYIEEAIFCCNKGIHANPERLSLLKMKAVCLNSLGRFEEALEILDEVLKKQRDALALTAKGYALMSLGKYEKSIECFDEALRIDPSMLEAKIYKGIALILLGKIEDAMKIPEFKDEYARIFEKEMSKMGLRL